MGDWYQFSCKIKFGSKTSDKKIIELFNTHQLELCEALYKSISEIIKLEDVEIDICGTELVERG